MAGWDPDPVLRCGIAKKFRQQDAGHHIGGAHAQYAQNRRAGLDAPLAGEFCRQGGDQRAQARRSRAACHRHTVERQQASAAPSSSAASSSPSRNRRAAGDAVGVRGQGHAERHQVSRIAGEVAHQIRRRRTVAGVRIRVMSGPVGAREDLERFEYPGSGAVVLQVAEDVPREIQCRGPGGEGLMGENGEEQVIGGRSFPATAWPTRMSSRMIWRATRYSPKVACRNSSERRWVPAPPGLRPGRAGPRWCCDPNRRASAAWTKKNSPRVRCPASLPEGGSSGLREELLQIHAAS